MKKIYMQPIMEIAPIDVENYMTTVSPGIGGDWDDGMIIEAKKNNHTFLDDSYDDWGTDDGNISENTLGCDFGSIW